MPWDPSAIVDTKKENFSLKKKSLITSHVSGVVWALPKVVSPGSIFLENWSKNRASWSSRSCSTVAPGKAKLFTAAAAELEEIAEEAKKST